MDDDYAGDYFSHDEDDSDDNCVAAILSQIDLQNDIEPDAMDYQCIDIAEVIEKVKKLSEYLSDVMNLPPAIVRLILRESDQEKILEEYGKVLDITKSTDFDDDEAWKERAQEYLLAITYENLQMDLTNSINFATISDGECEICLMDNVEIRCLKCMHYCCEDCWNNHVKSQLNEKGIDITCTNCDILLTDEQVHKLILEDDLRSNYNKLLAKSYVERNKKLHWCRGKGCEIVLEMLNWGAVSAYCDQCGSDFCPACNDIAHLPLNCKEIKAWADEKRDDLETIKIIDETTRPCPKCNVRIEKNGGCNYMQCRNMSCAIFFCWTCMKILSQNHERHNCNVFQGAFESVKNLEDERFRHYKLRFDTHKQSEKLEATIKDKVQFLIERIDGTENCTYNIKIVKNAYHELMKCRRILTYSCPFSYYIKDKNVQKIFDDNIEHLEVQTEGMSAMFEDYSILWHGIGQELIDTFRQLKEKTTIIKQRRARILEHCAECDIRISTDAK